MTRPIESGSRPSASWQRRIEARFEAWGRFVIRHRIAAVTLSVVVTAVLLAQLPKLTIDNSPEAMLLDDDPAVVAYQAFREQFGREDRLVVLVEAPEVGGLSEPARLHAIDDLIGAKVIGIAVDDTIHFMHEFHRHFDETADLEFAACETLRTTGTAMLFTSVALALGFAVMGASNMKNIRIFGLFSALATVVAFAADLWVGPALLALIERTRRRGTGAGARPVLTTRSPAAD